MNDLVRCTRCNKTLIAESFEKHDCSPIFKDTKTILIDWFTTTNDAEGRTTILANCMDGVLLSLVVNDKEAMPIPFKPSDELLREAKSDGEVTEPVSGFCCIFCGGCKCLHAATT